MISINLTFLIQMVNVAVLLILMNLVLYRPIRRIVAQRNQFIADQREAIDNAEATVASVVEEFNTRLQEARRLGREKIQEIKLAAYEREKEVVQAAMDQAAKQVQVGRMTIQADIREAREQLQAQVRAFSVELAQKILGRSLS